MTSLPFLSISSSSVSQTLPLIKRKVQHIINISTMLCCGRKKDSRGASNQRIVGEGGGLGMRYMTQPGYPIYQDPMDMPTGALVGGPPLRRAVHFPVSAYSFHSVDTDGSRHPDMVIQGDFRKVSGITSEIFRQIEAVEREYDATTAAHMEAAEKRGEMLIRLLDPRSLGKAGAEVARKYLEPTSSMDGSTSVQFVEIVKRPGQTLGLYIREGDGFRSSDGVFISRIALESPVYNSGLLKVGDEILAVNLVDVRRMSLDDVVIIMSIPRRLVLTIRSRAGRLGGPLISGPGGSVMMGNRRLYEGEEYRQPPVVVLKKEFGDEEYGTDDLSSNRDDENGHLLSDRLKGLTGADLPLQALGYHQNESDSYSESPYGYVRLAPRHPSGRPTDSWSVSGTINRKPPFPGVAGNSIPGMASMNNPLGVQRFPRTMDSLNQIYSGYNSDVSYSSVSRGGVPPTAGRSPMMSRSFIERGSPSRAGNRYAGEGDYAGVGTGSLRRNIRLLRTESDNNISPLTRDFRPDHYIRPQSRSSGRSMTSADYHSLVAYGKTPNDIRSSLSTHGLSSILRRRGQHAQATDGSVSDTEVGGLTGRHPSHWRHKSSGHGRYGGPSSREVYQWKSSSLPRQSGSGLTSDYRYNRPSSQLRRGQRGGQSVRFERNNNAYNAAYDDDSDGALSAPELPENYRSKRSLGRRHMSGRLPQDEYKQWIPRAPSTSAIYETIRRTSGRSSALPSGLSSTSLSRIAHSAESLLDTIRTQKSMLADIYANRPGLGTDRSTSQLPSSLLKPDLSSDSVSTIGVSHSLRPAPAPSRPLISAATPTAIGPTPPGMPNSANITSGVIPTSGISSIGAPASAISTLTGENLRSIPHPTPVKASEEERMHLLTLNPREFFKYRYEKPPPESEVSPSTGTATGAATSGREGDEESGEADKKDTRKKPLGFNGVLWIHLLAGRGLRSGSVPTNHRDLYCVIECDRVHKARTVVRSGESSFDWDEIFELDLVENKEISFLLYSWDPQYRHKLCYKGSINLIGLSLIETPVHSLALKMEPKGTLYIKIRYKDISISFQRTPLSPTIAPANAVFGLGLESLVNRENSGLSVPLIVKRCTQEVEKRGLTLVGIYRLCGSAVRKKLLREAFEKNSWLVDLSAEHVPDINVITSLLKDYIRELPEPLFTKALFDMMVDGLSVCLPDDPPGNAKLMFSILECLPKINRSTVLFLMDHLKLVESQSERNKMNSQALATAFGPLFTAHPESESLRKPIEVFKFLIEIWPARRGSTSHSNSTDSLLNGKSGQPGTAQGIHTSSTGPHQHSADPSKISNSGAVASAPSLPTSTSSSSSSKTGPVIGSSLTYVASSRDPYHYHNYSHLQQSQHQQPHQTRASLPSSNDDNLGIPSLTPGPSPTQLNERLSPDSPPSTRNFLTKNQSTSSPSSAPVSSQNYAELYSSTNPFRSDPYSSQTNQSSTVSKELETSETARIRMAGVLTGSINTSDRSTIKKSVAWAAGTRNSDEAVESGFGNNNFNLNSNPNTQGNYSSSTSKETNHGVNVITTSSSSSSSSSSSTSLVRDRHPSSKGDNNNTKNYSSSSSS
ncbi:rho GTPase-activating protein 100F isoform X2 [Tetranychus urticae]|uniref:rho GTPase-activating protein 100F isoform X2 n=1 Tax=Tetranychus urticae TaxID=32264 RepID=UPI000D65EA7C|nr:rho GTPase-activating protein 100F isoform X2 [Tetranychus urticae]